MTDTRLNVAYQAAHDTLSGRYNGDIVSTAERVARELAYRSDHATLTRSYNARRPLVDRLVVLAAAAKVRGGVDHCRPLLDNAVALAASALLADAAERG
jgi:hypothetical protein